LRRLPTGWRTLACPSSLCLVFCTYIHNNNYKFLVRRLGVHRDHLMITRQISPKPRRFVLLQRKDLQCEGLLLIFDCRLRVYLPNSLNSKRRKRASNVNISGVAWRRQRRLWPSLRRWATGLGTWACLLSAWRNSRRRRACAKAPILSTRLPASPWLQTRSALEWCGPHSHT
jgi:hypothetical protein